MHYFLPSMMLHFSSMVHYFSSMVHYFSSMVHYFSSMVHYFSSMVHYFSSMMHYLFHLNALIVIFFQHGSLLATGSRDRNLNLFDLKKLDSNAPSLFESSQLISKQNAHDVSLFI